jgi:serine/threonine protein kinase
MTYGRRPFTALQSYLFCLCPNKVIWEWLNWEEEWYPYTRTVNVQIEELFQSEGAKWMEVVVDLPSPTPILLDLHHQRQVNLTTGARWPIRRLEYAVREKVPLPSCMHHYEILEEDSATVESDDELSSTSISKSSGNGTSAFLGNRLLMSEEFIKIQVDVKVLQVPRDNILRFIRDLGEGQFGKVHLGEAINIPRLGNKEPVQVACKQLRLSDHSVHHNQQIMDFLREAKEMSKFYHPRVVKLLAVCTTDFPLIILTEYMNKGDLLGVLQDSRPHMDLHLQMRFAAEVADGMIYLSNEMDCVHRDLAARNIMIHEDREGEMHAKIADFGLSRHVYSGIYTPTTVKKARPLPAKWMALESLIDFVFTTRSDVWSFGVLLWEIMTLGRNPYPGIDNRDLLEQIEEKGLKLSQPKKCPEVVFDVIMKCTSHDANKRPSFKTLWEQCVQFESEAREGKLRHVHPKAIITKPIPPLPTENTEITTQDEANRHTPREVTSATVEQKTECKQQQQQQQQQDASEQCKGNRTDNTSCNRQEQEQKQQQQQEQLMQQKLVSEDGQSEKKNPEEDKSTCQHQTPCEGKSHRRNPDDQVLSSCHHCELPTENCQGPKEESGRSTSDEDVLNSSASPKDVFSNRVSNHSTSIGL